MIQMVHLKRIALCAFLTYSCQCASAQDKTVTGKVVDSKDGTAVAHVSIVVKGTHTGTQTDSAGNFQINLPKSATRLTISAIGYSTQNVDVGKSNYVEVSLASVVTVLNDIV